MSGCCLGTYQPGSNRQEEGHTGFLHLPCGVLALIFLARRIQPFFSLVDREVEFCVLRFINRSLLDLFGIFIFIFVRKNKNLSSCDDTGIRTDTGGLILGYFVIIS